MTTSINDKILSSISTKSDTMDKSLYKTNEISDNGFNDIFDNIQQKSLGAEKKLNSQAQNSNEYNSNTDNKYSQKNDNVSNIKDERSSADSISEGCGLEKQSQETTEKIDSNANEIGQAVTDKDLKGNNSNTNDISSGNTTTEITTETTTEDSISLSSSKETQAEYNSVDENAVKLENSDNVQVKDVDSGMVANNQQIIDLEVEDNSLLNSNSDKEVVIKQDATSVIFNDEISSNLESSSVDNETSDSQNVVLDSEVLIDSSEASNILTTEDTLNLDFVSESKEPTIVKSELENDSEIIDMDSSTVNAEIEGSVEFVSINNESNNTDIDKSQVENTVSPDKEKITLNEINKNIINEETKKSTNKIAESQKATINIAEESELTTNSSGLQISVSDEAQVNNKNITTTTSEDIEKNNILKQNIINDLKVEISQSKKDLLGDGSFNSQNASEQVIKLSLNSSLDSTGSDFSNLMTSDSLLINNLSKTDMTSGQIQSAPTTISKTDILTQITDKLNSTKIAGGEKIEMILKPESLGKVNVELQSNKGQITATIVAESASVKEVLEKNIETLKNNLASQGVQLNNVTVKVQESEKAFSGNLDFAQEQFENFNQQQKNSEASGSENYEQGEFMGNLDSEIESDELVENGNESEKSDSQTIGLVNYKI